MSDQQQNDTKKRMGRPATGQGTPVMVRVHPDMLDWLDRERKKATPEKTRPEMVRWFLEIAQGTLTQSVRMKPKRAIRKDT